MNPIVANSHFYSFERKKSHKSFEKVEKGDEMEIKESPNLFDHHAIFIQKYVEFSNLVYFIVIDKNRAAMLPEEHVFSYVIFEKTSLKIFKQYKLKPSFSIKG